MKRLNIWHFFSGIKAPAAVLGLALSVVAAPTEAALIAYWDFNEAIDTADAVDSVAGNNAVFNGTATRAAGPIGFGRALSLDGTAGGFAEVGVVPALSLVGTDYTVAWWANANDPAAAGTQRLINRDDGTDFSGGYDFRLDGGALAVSHNNTSNNNNGFGAATFVQDVWAHYAITYTSADVGSELKAYKDGSLVGTAAILGGGIIDDGDDSLVFGAIPVFNQNFDGLLDEIRIYDNALTGSQIAALVPEPSSMLFGTVTMVGLLVVRRRKS